MHVHDEVELAIEELLRDNSRSILIARRLNSEWVETKYVTIPNLSSSAARKKVIESEHNEST